MRFDLIRRPQPFLGILLAAAGWALSHQVGSDTLFDDCSRGGSFMVLVSLAGLLITAAGGFYASLGWRGTDQGRSLLGLLGVLLAVLAGFAIVLQITAGLILPECAA
jgi:hypothetical protein